MATPISKSANPATNPAVSTPPQRPALRSETRPQATEARGTNESKRTETRRGAERPEAGNGRDRVELERSNPRPQGREVIERGADVSRLQQAGRAVDGGIEDLRKLGKVAEQAEKEPTAEGRARLQSEADTLGNRIAAADEDEGVQRTRREVEESGREIQQSDRERDAEAARTEAGRAGRRADSARGRPDGDPPTLVLEPRRENAEEAAEEARKADEAAKEAERRAEAGEADAERRQRPVSTGDDEGGERAGTRTENRRSFRPETTDVSTPERAQETRRAAGEAEDRAVEFRREIGNRESEAGRRAEAAVREERGNTRRVSNEAESRETAARVVQDAQRNPRQFVDAQARVSAEAAVRLLA
jgi:hypothetical protein